MQVVLDLERCKSCLHCIRFCPHEALVLSDRMNRRGYVVVSIDSGQCTACGMCYLVCPDNVFQIVRRDLQ